MPQTTDTRITTVDDLNVFLGTLQNALNQLTAAVEMLAKANGVIVAAKESVLTSAQKFTGALQTPAPAEETKAE